MRYRFDRFELDTEQYALRADGDDIHVEPLVFDLLSYLVEHAGQVAPRDAIIEHVWKGRFVSDATVSSCIKSARKALGDSGQDQAYIRTIRGRGFQLTASVTSIASSVETSPSRAQQQAGGEPGGPTKAVVPPSIAVLPLFPLSLDPQLGLLGDAIAQEVILELSRLHWLFVIARGSSFKFRGNDIDPVKVGEVLGASYLLTGTLMQQAGLCVISVEITRAPDNNVIWAERFTTPTDELMYMRSTLAGEIVGALEPRIQRSEALNAAKVPTEHLDAWSAYHRGLWHMFRFNKRDNDQAAQLFARSVGIDPGFARAHAGLSFTHFQKAFLGFSPDIEGEKRQARLFAERCMELDPLDPFVNLTMGRVEWLSSNLESAQQWMERSISLSPNYAFAIYNSALVGTFLGEHEGNETKIAKAISLSPIDPLNYAMLATRALTHSIRGDFRAAAAWADRAVRSPNAHVQIYAIAAFTNELTGNRQKAEEYVSHIRRSHPTYVGSDFIRSFPFRDGNVRKQVEQSLQRLGL
ncbi:MAG: winged helix-turn-helix domain-containing protein [Hyphomicrobiaceae bacterium]|nr:winged helix-turn-helix domain-containing protein [Hyphomicrobiaceae bacterium]